MPREDVNTTNNIINPKSKKDSLSDEARKNLIEHLQSIPNEEFEAMEPVNVPNILDNELDQAPKTKEAGYEENVLRPLAKEIDERMDMFFMNWSDLICDYITDFVNKPENRFILDKISSLKPWDSMAFEIKREKVKDWWWRVAVWHPASPEDLNNYFHNFYSRNKNPIERWEVSSAIIIKKDENDPKLIKVHAEQLEIPKKWAMLDFRVVNSFHNPDVSDEDFEEIIKAESNEEAEDNEAKEQKNEVKKEWKKEKNKSIKDKFKWRF